MTLLRLLQESVIRAKLQKLTVRANVLLYARQSGTVGPRLLQYRFRHLEADYKELERLARSWHFSERTLCPGCIAIVAVALGF